MKYPPARRNGRATTPPRRKPKPYCRLAIPVRRKLPAFVRYGRESAAVLQPMFRLRHAIPPADKADLTCALAMSIVCAVPRSFAPPPICTGGVPFSAVRMSAPIAASGSATRRIGRRISEESPIRVAATPHPAATPQNKRIKVPELPQSISAAGARNPPPSTVSRPSSRSQTFTPHAQTALMVARTSSLIKMFEISLVPSASAASMTARCDTDLSDGTRHSPRNSPPGDTTKRTVIFLNLRAIAAAMPAPPKTFD